MSHNIRFGGGVTSSGTISASSWGMETVVITESSNTSRLIHCEPVLYPISVCLETEVGKVGEGLTVRINYMQEGDTCEELY